MMEIFCNGNACFVREVYKAFPEPRWPSSTTVRPPSIVWGKKKPLRVLKRITDVNIRKAAEERRALALRSKGR